MYSNGGCGFIRKIKTNKNKKNQTFRTYSDIYDEVSDCPPSLCHFSVLARVILQDAAVSSEDDRVEILRDLDCRSPQDPPTFLKTQISEPGDNRQESPTQINHGEFHDGN